MMQPTFFNSRVNKCDHCLFSTNSKDVLSNHIKRVHDGIASHICHLCSVACWYVEHKDYILHVPELILLKNKNIKIEHQYFFCSYCGIISATKYNFAKSKKS